MQMVASRLKSILRGELFGTPKLTGGSHRPDVRLGFWNTSLRPPSTKARTEAVLDERLLRAWLVLDYLIKVKDIDILAVCEVDEPVLKRLAATSAFHERVIASSISVDGHFIQDNALIYNPSLFKLVEQADIVREHYSGKLRVATLYQMEHVTGDLISFYVSHWPGRGSRPDLAIGRDELGSTLKEAIDLSSKGMHNSRTIILGDFNDEPFSNSIADKLMASRDRQLVISKPSFMYNPFWRKLGGIDPHVRGENPDTAYGTYFYKGSMGNTKWHTFDQMIFSSSFLSDDLWHLIEEATTIHYEIFGHSIRRKPMFDHMPISTMIKRVL